MICTSCFAQAHRLHFTKFGQICDECLAELKDPDLTPRTTRQITRLPERTHGINCLCDGDAWCTRIRALEAGDMNR